MNRKWPAIDLIKLYSHGDSNKWNQWLLKCEKTHNISELKKIRYGIQAGMTDLSNKKLNDQHMSIFFIRLQRSIEIALKNILKQKYPHPLDSGNKKHTDDWKSSIKNKRKRDDEFEKFLKESSF